MYKEVGKTKKKPFLAGFSLRNKQSSRGSAGIHNRFSLCQHFRTQQQQRWQKNTRQTAKKSNGKTPKTNRNYLLQRFSRTSSTKNIRTGSSFSQGNVPGRIKTKCSSRRKDFLFCPILGKAHKRSGNFRNSEGIQNSLVKDTSPRKHSSEYTPKKESLTKQRSACSKSISEQSEQSSSCKELRWGVAVLIFESSESVCTLNALQDGKFADSKIYDEGKRLHVQSRFEGRLI